MLSFFHSILSFGQSNVKSAHLVHRKYRASSDSRQSKINFKLSPLCANTSSQIFSTLMATDTISDLLKVEWYTADGLGRFYSVWSQMEHTGKPGRSMLSIGSMVKTFCF